jgi:hypothetical protein
MRWTVILGLVATAAFIAAVTVSSKVYEPTIPTSTTLPPVTTRPPPTTGRVSSTLPSSTGPSAPPAPGPPGAQGPPGPPGPPGNVVFVPPPPTGPPSATVTSTTVGVTTTKRCRVPQSTVNPATTRRPCLP